MIGEYDFGSGTITTAGVNLMGADWTSATSVLKLAKWMDTGTGTNVASVNDTALQTPTGNLRISGTQANINNTLTVTATLAYTTGATISEWGLFTAPTNGTLWDRRLLSVAQAVIGGDNLQFTYSLQIQSGG